jgi:hypothetical protein
MEVAAFWIGVAAVLIASGWYKSRTEAQKHQTFRAILEKTGTVDEAQLKLLFPAQASHSFFGPNVPGSGYRALRVGGAILMIVGAGGIVLGGALFAIIMLAPVADQGAQDGPGIFLFLGIAAFLLGGGCFYSSRFAEKPAAESERPGAGP